jgi:hypothetical protein
MPRFFELKAAEIGQRRPIGCGRNAYLANRAAEMGAGLTRGWARRETAGRRPIGLFR